MSSMETKSSVTTLAAAPAISHLVELSPPHFRLSLGVFQIVRFLRGETCFTDGEYCGSIFLRIH
jgi:hypothetical protein